MGAIGHGALSAHRVLVASIMAGSGSDKELHNWQLLTEAVQDAVLCSVSTQAVKAAARVPVWVKLTPATATIVEGARATFTSSQDDVELGKRLLEERTPKRGIKTSVRSSGNATGSGPVVEKHEGEVDIIPLRLPDQA